MLGCFFSNSYADRDDLFEGLHIWEYEEYRQIQGTYPVISLSFAPVKETENDTAVTRILKIICELYRQNVHLLESDKLNRFDKKEFEEKCQKIEPKTAADSLNFLSHLLYEHYGKKVIILLDEYDTPLQEAYLNDYWTQMVQFIRNLFNATFKTNPYLERAVLTGITRVSKDTEGVPWQSIFSDMNNLEVVTATSQKYATAFGFTEEEVFASLEEFELSEQKEYVKMWYDGFTFGNVSDIYNPWSITKFLSSKELGAHWANTSSNGLINMLVKQGNNDIKKTMEHLLAGEVLETELDEEIVFQQLDYKDEAVWSLMLASGYLKIESTKVERFEDDDEEFQVIYYLKLTNYEVKHMFKRMIADWFQRKEVPYNEFLRAMQNANLREMNIYMSQILLETVSSFDIANRPSDKLHPERFYHGLVLGLMATERKYEVRSNGESGYGRYDITMVPKRTVRERGEDLPSFVIEFKLFNPEAPDYEKTLEDTAACALEQIREKAYDTAIISQGIPREQIRHYGFGFEGKKVFIGTEE